MDCERAIELLERFLDGEASPAEKRDAEAHLEGCERCREHVLFLTAVSNHSRASDLPEPPESYWEHLPRKILKRIDSERALRERGIFERILSPGVLRLGALAATIGLLVVVGVNVLRDDPLRVASESVPPQAMEDEPTAPAAAAPPLEEGLSKEAPETPEVPEMPEVLDSLRALGYVAGDDEKPAEASPRPTAPAPSRAPAIQKSEEGAASAFADVAGEADQEQFERRQVRENAARLEVQNEPQEEVAGGRAERARARDLDDCERWREKVSSAADEGESVADVRYELARCSIERLEEDASDERRATAIQDAEAFLLLEGEGTRADEIREALRAAIGR